MTVTVLSYENKTATVKLEPNWFNRLFGYTTKIVELIDDNMCYKLLGGKVWFFKETGDVYGMCPEAEAFVRKLKFEQENT